MKSNYELVKEVLEQEQQALIDMQAYDEIDEFQPTRYKETPWRWEYQHESCSYRGTMFKRRLTD